MARMAIEVKCPCCHTTLKVDAETGVVLTHKEPEKPKPIDDIRVAVAALKTDAARREDVFQKSLADHKTRQSTLDKKFDELFKQAKESPNEKPFRPDFDLD
ncbi:MAG: hypothetical protein H7Y20_13995 [Bryobacteraceae bacterium]|nr:hypothetical protein [Bryobacteraceae bacterium]